MGAFDVDDLTNKVDVGSQPGTMWSLSSQKPGHGIAELRDDDTNKLWQSDGFLPHLINIQFARRTAVTHVSIYTDFRLDDSYTPIRIRIMAGTHHHDLVEVRTREFVQPLGWKHFVMDKFDSVAESEESDSGSSSTSNLSDAASDGEGFDEMLSSRRAGAANPSDTSRTHSSGKSYLSTGVSRKHPPIHTYLVQVCILSNHAIGKDTHVRGLKIFGPATSESREKARRQARREKEGRRLTGLRAARHHAEKNLKNKRRAMEGLRRWMQEDVIDDDDDDDDHDNADTTAPPEIATSDHSNRRPVQPFPSSMRTSRGLQLQSSLR